MSCPICRKATDTTYQPFCSRRCADVDLARWLRADYAIPAPLTEMDEETADQPTDSDDK
ncbi:MAG: DNA gyrase inhibitor YacG [Roseinatronobacter sp.]|jgi:endogenous inhibitor of DNA gyrase (YacG/DUF329 family)|nr:DNA gyrase inhibitor YacG [Roseinatronobacter sp.]